MIKGVPADPSDANPIPHTMRMMNSRHVDIGLPPFL
jgi:hypothetical protein